MCGQPGQEHHGTERTSCKQRERWSIPLKACAALGAHRSWAEWWMGHIYFKYTSIVLPSIVAGILLLLEWGHETLLLWMVLQGRQAHFTLDCVYMYIHAPHLQNVFTDNRNSRVRNLRSTRTFSIRAHVWWSLIHMFSTAGEQCVFSPVSQTEDLLAMDLRILGIFLFLFLKIKF